MLTIERLSQLAHQLTDDAGVASRRHGKRRYGRVLMRSTSLERALRSSEQRSTDIFSARDVESIKQRALASIRSQEPPERRFFQMQ
jgi:hypothetical protein